MELWFWFAVLGAVLGGVPSFLLKFATKQKYNSELFILYGAVASVVILIPVSILVLGVEVLSWGLVMFGVGSGVIASFGGILRLYALHAIDTTIYFPLVKVLSPTLAIISGIIFFNESFTNLEWLGLLSGIFVPILLISKLEGSRQNNLALGLFLIVVTGLISAIFSSLSKFSIDFFGAVLWFLTLSSAGVLIGSLLVIAYKQGYKNLISHIKTDTNVPLATWSVIRGVVISVSFGSVLFAYSFNGPLAIVHTIHSLYILIPIVLSIIFYNEHWNTQKIIAIILSVAALALLQ